VTRAPPGLVNPISTIQPLLQPVERRDRHGLTAADRE
jgi:hypothetical protein